MESFTLEQRWNRLVAASGAEISAAQSHFSNLCQAYTEPQRHYHTLDHITQMLNWLDEAGVDDVAALWAAWYHDWVYNPGKKDNEARSGVQASAVLSEIGVEASIIGRVVRIIEATKDHKVDGAADQVLHFVLDADMAILGVPEQQYEQYCSAVRSEFKSVPNFLYKRGRKKFLQSVLKQEKIYSTDWFFERFEAQARINVELELSKS